MRVVILSSEYSPFIFGGVGTFVGNLALGLQKSGVEVTVVSGYPFSSKAIAGTCEKNAGVDIVRLPYPDIPPRHMLWQLVNLKKLCKIVQGIRPDVVHGQQGSIFPASLKLRTLAPIVVTFHSSARAEQVIACHSILRGGTLGDLRTYAIAYPLHHFTYKRELRDSRVAVAVSKAMVQELLTEMGEEYRGKIRAIQNGVDLEELDREYAEADRDEAEGLNTVLYAGRLFWRKGALNLVKMADLFRQEHLNLKLIVHGTGPLFGRIKDEIKERGLGNVTMKGFTSKRELMSSMRKCTFVVLPSFYEGFPMILLESMCLGKIPVMFDLPYARELTQNGEYGILANNVDEMVMKMKNLVLKNANLGSLQSKIRNYSRNSYDVNHTVLQYRDLYREVCQ